MQDKEEVSFYKLFNPLTTKKSLIFLIILGIFVYFNALFNGFVGDDFPFILDNPNVHSIENIPKQFIQGSFYDESNQSNNYYRPLFSVVVTSIYSISNANPFLYHLVQLILHITNAAVLFLIFETFFKRNVSLILSILFLISPINNESVVYISSMQEALFLFFGLFALLITIKYYSKPSHLLIPFLLFLSLLSKETGIAFLFLIPFFNYLYNKKRFILSIIQSFVVFLFYLFLRLFIAHIGFGSQVDIAPVQTIPLYIRLLSIPKIVSFYITTFFYPKDLIMFQTWLVKDLGISDFYFPLLLDITFFGLLFLAGRFIYTKNSQSLKPFIFFLIWFGLTLLLIINIIPLDQTVADRWFYLPIIGLLGTIGLVGTNLINLLNKSLYKKMFLLLVIILISVLSLRTIIRTSDWKDEQTLVNHDIKLNNDSYQLQTSMGSDAYTRGSFQTAEAHYVRAANLFPSHLTYMNLGNIYMLMNQPKKAANAFEIALKYKGDNAFSWVYTGIAKYNFGDKENGIKDVEKAYSLLPNDSILTILTTMKKGDPINISN